MSKTDLQLTHDVEQELQWEPSVNAIQVHVAVARGAVSLRGTVHTFAEKCATEEAAKRVSGVRTVVQELVVALSDHHKRSDQDLYAAINHAFKWDVFVPEDVVATVHAGAVDIVGQVEWNYQREAAERALRHLAGVVAIDNKITLTPRLSTIELKAAVEAALYRQFAADGRLIKVDIVGGTVMLTGHAPSWQSIRNATHAAWATPGVTEVVGQIRLLTVM